MAAQVLTKKKYLAEFGGNKTAAGEFVGVTRQAVDRWGKHVPSKHYIGLAHREPAKWGYLIRQ